MMAVVFLLITVWMVAVSECTVSKNADHYIAPALASPLNARDTTEPGFGKCNTFHRSTKFHIDIASHRSRLKELHVRHNLKGLVEMEDSDRDGHLVTVDVKTDASSESELNRVVVIHRIVEASDMRSILIVQADVRTVSVGNTFSMFYLISIVAGALLVILTIGAIWTCYKRCRPLRETSGRGAEPGGNMLALTGLQSQGSFGFHLTSQTSVEVQSTTPGNDIRQLTVPLASSGGHVQTSKALRLTSEQVPNFMETSFDVEEPHSDTIRPSYLFGGSMESRTMSSPSTVSSRRVETASILTVMVVALAMSVHTMCVDDINVHIIIKLPRSLLLEDVKIFYNEKYNNHVEMQAWSRNSSILHIFDLPSASTTENSPCNETLLCGSAHHSRLSDATATACDWSTRNCVCQRGSVMINDVCASPPAEADLDSDAELLPSNQVTAVASANLLLENLHNAGNLETTYYVTDTKQLTDFFWYRASGIRVNVGLQNIDVIPTYEDVDHEGDGDFMMQNPSGKAELEYFRSIQLNRCRYPMPDYYSLTLEIAKDRTTKASMEVCTMQEYSAGRCPQGIHIGDSYVRRMLNEPCHKMGSYPEPLQPAANSIVCTDSTLLLTAVFNITPAAVHPIPLVSDACRIAGNQCDQCLSQPRCRLSDELDRGCCLLDCYIRPECKLATGAYCKNPPLECAQGDSYRYTLQPVYQDLRNSYQCHIRRKSPDILYELWFYVSIPSSNFETPRLYTAIQLSETNRHTSRGKHQHEFITVEYSFDIDLEEDLILKGLQHEPGLWNHTVHPLGQSSNKFPLVGALRELSKNVFIASVNFDEPFAFSSSTWVVGDGCQKNVSKFVPPPSQEDASQQAVSVSTNNLGQPFKYLIKAANSPPSIRVLIPGNISLLRWWFRDKPPFLITGNSLHANLTFNGTSMMVNIQGFLTGCPGYLGILVNDLHRMREVVKYDVLVSCPQQFSVTFNVVNQDPFMDQALEVLIDDAKHISQLLLIYSPTEQRRRQKVRVTEDRRAAFFLTIGLLNLLFAAALTLVFLSAVFWACSKSLWLVCQRIVRRNSGKLPAKQDARFPVSDRKSSCYCTSSPRHLTFKSMNAHQRTLVILYILWKILYIIFCTFTVFFLLLNAFIGPKAADISETVDQLQTGNSKKLDLYQQALEEQIEIDLIQQSEFLEKIYREELYCLEELLNRTRVRLENLTQTLSPKSVMANKLKNRISLYHKNADIFTENYHKKFDDDLYPLVNRYKSYIDVLGHNRWFLFPQRLFNSTLEQSKVMGGSVGRSTANTSAKAQFRFWDFLGVQEVDQVQQWTKSVWNNYFSMMSSAIDLHTIPVARDNSCEESSSTISMSWNQTLSLVNSTRFFNSLRQREKPNRKTDPLLSFDIYSDVQAYGHHNSLLDVDRQQNFDVVNLVEHLHIEIIRIIFFCVDIILLFHRCAHLYRRTQSMFTGFKCRTVLGHSQFWHLRLAAELNGGHGITTHPLKTKQQNHMSSSSSSIRSPRNEGKCMSDGILLVTKPTSDLTPCAASCNNLLPVGHDSSYAPQNRSNSCSAISVNDLKSSQSVFCYFNVVLQGTLLRRLGLAVLVVLLLHLLMTSVNCILLSFAGCYPQMAALYQDLVDISEQLSMSSWQHLIQLAYWYKSREILEFHFSISSLQSFVEEQEEMKRRNYLDQVCFLFADGVDKSCVSSNESDGWVQDDVNTRIIFPCPYNSNRSHFHTLPELNISCTKNLAVLVRSTHDAIADAWQVLLASVLLIVVLHALGTVILHIVKKCNIFPIRYICETSSPSTLSPSSSASRVNRSIASSYSAEKCEAVSCKLELPAVYRIISSTTPDTSPSSQSNIAGMSRRSRVRFAPTVQVSSANSSFGSIPTQMQMEVGYAESNV